MDIMLDLQFNAIISDDDAKMVKELAISKTLGEGKKRKTLIDPQTLSKPRRIRKSLPRGDRGPEELRERSKEIKSLTWGVMEVLRRGQEYDQQIEAEFSSWRIRYPHLVSACYRRKDPKDLSKLQASEGTTSRISGRANDQKI